MLSGFVIQKVAGRLSVGRRPSVDLARSETEVADQPVARLGPVLEEETVTDVIEANVVLDGSPLVPWIVTQRLELWWIDEFLR